MSFYVLDIIEFRSQWIIHINCNDFPIRFPFIKKCHSSKNLNLFNLSWISYFLTNFTNIKRIIISFGFCFRMSNTRIFPCLPLTATRKTNKRRSITYLRNSAVGKGISVMRETIPYESQFTLFNILLNGIVI
jgi:hypothetical protein